MFSYLTYSYHKTVLCNNLFKVGLLRALLVLLAILQLANMESNFRVRKIVYDSMIAAVDDEVSLCPKDHMKHSCTQNHRTVNLKVLLIHGKS